MCFRRPFVLLLLTALVALSACGRKEPPKPPPSKIPAPINDLVVQQRGQELLFSMTFPSVTLGGLPIEELTSLEIWKMSRILAVAGVDSESDPTSEPSEAERAMEPDVEVPEPEAIEEAEEPEASLFALPGAAEAAVEEQPKESLIEVRGRDFAAIAKPTWIRQGSALDSTVIGDKIYIRVPLDEAVTVSEGDEILIFAARTLVDNKRASPFSNIVKLFPRTPPAAPRDLAVEATPDGIQIDWQPAADAIGYRIYRRNSEVRDYAEPLYKAREGLESYTDRTARFGERYIFTVTSVGNLDPLVESAIAAEHEVDYQDRFPPAAPTEVVALAETGRVRLLWQPSASADTQGYWIYRRDPGKDYQVVNTDLVVGSEYLDRNLASGQTYRYYLLAIDAEGNQSEASEEIEVRVP